MAHHFTDAEKAEWLKNQPRKPISSKLLLTAPSGKVLIVKPNYKPGWSLPGGMVEQAESPLQAVLRETKEEVGLALSAGQLTFRGVRYGVSSTGTGDFLHFLFAAQVGRAEIDLIRVSDPEIEDLLWTDLAEARQLIVDHVVGLLDSGNLSTAVYSEQDETIIPY